jgi:hypothetical protein
MMKRSIQIVLALGAILAPLAAAADSINPPQIGKSELRQMIHDAHTTAQYRVLAGYFRRQQQHFDQQAEAEKAEWIRRSANVSGPAAKYPRPVDSSRNRYEYFMSEAQDMDRQAAHYESLAASVN